MQENESGLYEPRLEKNGLRDVRQGLTQTGLYATDNDKRLEILYLERRGNALSK